MADLSFGPLSYGAANLGNLYQAMTDDQAHELLDVAWELGIRYFDTAPHYGLGLSERRLGAFLATKLRGAFTVSTKAGRLLRPNPEGGGRLDDENGFVVPADLTRVWDFSEDGLRRGLEESLQRLGLDSVDILYLHDPEEYRLGPALESGVPALARLRDEGAVTAIGVGSKSAPALLAAVRTGALDLLMVAGRLTLLDQRALDEVMPECEAGRVGVVNAAVFNSGLLASAHIDPTAMFDYDLAPPEVLARARAVAEVCARYGVELPAAALQYGLRHSVVRTVVVGAATAEQLRQNAARVRTSIPEEMWQELAERGLVP